MFFKRRTYLDYAAGVSANPSSPHKEGREAKKVLEDARTAIARLIEVQSDDVIFTSGATESNALAILGLLKKGDHALYLPSAHASIVENMKLAGTRGVEVEELPLKDMRVNCEKLKRLLRPQTRLVAMEAVCGETGVVWNTREVANIIQVASETRFSRSLEAVQPLATKIAFSLRPRLHVDASQAPMTEKITRARFAADTLTFDASKVGAIRGIGVLIAHRTTPLIPLYEGGGQERALRSGSEAPELARGFAEALGAVASNQEKFRARTEKDRKSLTERIIKAVPNVYINEGPRSTDRQASHILNLSLPGRDTDYLVALLDEAGFSVSTRSACETDSQAGSRAVYALTKDEARARTTLRISWGPNVSARELGRFAQALVEAVAFIDKGASR